MTACSPVATLRKLRRFNRWFDGFTPRLSSAVWVGYPTQRVPMTTLYYGAPVAGGSFPAEIWGAYMKQAKGKFCGGFKPPTVRRFRHRADRCLAPPAVRVSPAADGRRSRRSACCKSINRWSKTRTTECR